MVGEYKGGARLFTAPVAATPEPTTVIRTPHDRQRALALGRTFAWCTLLALRGTPLEDAAARCILSASAFTGSTDRMANFEGPGAGAHFTIGARPAAYLAASPLATSSSNAGAAEALARLIRDDYSLIEALDARHDDELLSGGAVEQQIVRAIEQQAGKNEQNIVEAIERKIVEAVERKIVEAVELKVGTEL
ncbi:hypothetical protein AB1Y20_017087 [Prymnesium parvum]|uniref:Uncharacterized protein n=1 Tax=Prymnesium parvum TaxID=97485 RepID=A0AB34IBF0_PRYPA